MYMKKKWIAAATIAALLPFSPLKPAAEQIDDKKIKGNLVIAGGALGSSNKAVYDKFIELAGGTKNAKVGIIPAASGSLKSSAAFKKDMVTLGINPDSVEILPLSNHDFSGTAEDESKWAANSNTDKVANQIKDLTAVWFVGGDQVKIVDTLRDGNKDSKALKAIWEMYEEGGVIGGTSAGAAIMSDVMITGGDSLGALKGQSAKANKEEYEPLTVGKGLGFFQHGIIDQHMNERARYGRLTVAAVKHEQNPKQNFAYGVDEDTAMVVSNEKGTVEVVGRSGVFLADVSQATSKEDKQNGFEVKNAKISYLSPGDKVNIDAKTVDVSSTKYLTNGEEYYTFKPLPATGVFTPYGRLQAYLSYSLVDNQQTDPLTSQLLDSKGKGFKLTFKKQKDTNGYWGYTDGQKDQYSFVNVQMDIKPMKVSMSGSKKDNSYQSPSFKAKNVPQEKVSGNLLIAGGAVGESNELYGKFVEEAGGKTKAKVGIIPAASGSLKSSEAFKKKLISIGVNPDNIEILPIASADFSGTPVDESTWKNNMNSEALANKVKGLSGIWFVGGDQTLITGSLLKEDGSRSTVLNAIWDMYKKGGILGGTSAGAAIMSNTMIAGGDSYNTLTKGFVDSYDGMEQQELGPGYVEQGLGFFQYGIIDQHFEQKARLGRLVATSYELGKKGERSYGIDEDTAMLVHNKTGEVEVLGRGKVTVVDIDNAKASKHTPRSYEDISLSALSPGDTINVKTNKITVSETKSETIGAEYSNAKTAPNTGVFSPHGLVNQLIGYDLVDNEANSSVKSYSLNGSSGFELEFAKTKKTSGYWGYTDGQRDSYSYENVSLSIKPITVKQK